MQESDWMVGACRVLFILLQLTVKSEARSIAENEDEKKKGKKEPGREKDELCGVWYMTILMVSE